MLLVEFINTGTIKKAGYSEVLTGEIKDNYAKIICNVACTGNASKTKNLREYKLWHRMITRCYNEKHLDKNPSYKDCRVHEDWLCFEYFLDTISQIEGYEDWLVSDNYELDKDTKIPNNKLYSVNTCRFIPRSENRGAMTEARIKGKCKPVQVINLENDEVSVYHSERECGRQLNIPQKSVNYAIKSNRKAHGYLFKHL